MRPGRLQIDEDRGRIADLVEMLQIDVDAGAPGAYIVTVREMGEGGDGALVASSGVVRTRGDELRGDGTDHELAALPGVPCIAAVLIFGHGDF